jgi:hypothetical protein
MVGRAPRAAAAAAALLAVLGCALLVGNQVRTGPAELGEEAAVLNGLVGLQQKPTQRDRVRADAAVARLMERYSPTRVDQLSELPDHWPAMSYWAKQREAAWKAKHDGAGTAQPSALAVAASARPANPQQARLAAAFHKLNGDDQGFAQMEAAYQKENGVPSAPPPQLAQEHAREGAPRYERHEAVRAQGRV